MADSSLIHYVVLLNTHTCLLCLVHHVPTTIAGGQNGSTTGTHANISAGVGNTASGTHSTVSGGQNREASGPHDWRAGGSSEDD